MEAFGSPGIVPRLLLRRVALPPAGCAHALPSLRHEVGGCVGAAGSVVAGDVRGSVFPVLLAVAQGVAHFVACLQGGAAADAAGVAEDGLLPALYEAVSRSGVPFRDESGSAFAIYERVAAAAAAGAGPGVEPLAACVASLALPAGGRGAGRTHRDRVVVLARRHTVGVPQRAHVMEPSVLVRLCCVHLRRWSARELVLLVGSGSGPSCGRLSMLELRVRARHGASATLPSVATFWHTLPLKIVTWSITPVLPRASCSPALTARLAKSLISCASS